MVGLLDQLHDQVLVLADVEAQVDDFCLVGERDFDGEERGELGHERSVEAELEDVVGGG